MLMDMNKDTIARYISVENVESLHPVISYFNIYVNVK